MNLEQLTQLARWAPHQIDPLHRSWNYLFEALAAIHEPRCRRCHRRLRTAPSVAAGIGPVCARKAEQ